MKTLLLTIVGFFISGLALFKWGASTADKKTAEKGETDALKQSQKQNDIYSKPFVDKPFGRLRREKTKNKL